MGTSQSKGGDEEPIATAADAAAATAAADEKENHMYKSNKRHSSDKSRLSPQYIEDEVAPASPKDRMSSSRQRSSKHRSSRDRDRDRGDRDRDRERRDRDERRSSRGDRGDGGEGSSHHRSRRDRGDRGERGNSPEGQNANGGARHPASPLHMSGAPGGDGDQQQQRAAALSSPLSDAGNTVASKRIADDAVQLDLPMADLMAYLQVVANNSSNLPLTRRDDPELGRTVSSLTAEEYAYKCAAFVPSNVRIIGGQFGKYGRVWDLPTSEVSISFVRWVVVDLVPRKLDGRVVD